MALGSEGGARGLPARFSFFAMMAIGKVKARKSRVKKIDLSSRNFAAEKESGFMIYFEQEIYQYKL